jgi:hypothetical protein
MLIHVGTAEALLDEAVRGRAENTETKRGRAMRRAAMTEPGKIEFRDVPDIPDELY